MNQPQQLEAIIKQLRAAEAKMNEDDHVEFATLCLFIFLFALMYLIGGHLLTFTVLSSCLGLAIPLYYWITALRKRSSWHWEPVRLELQGKDLHQMWNTSGRGDWLLWFCAHMIGKPGWPTHQEVVLASCQCARLALRHIEPGETRPLKSIETAEAWARGEATIEQVGTAGHAADRTTGNGDTAYCAAQAAHAVAWAVYATEDGACFRLAQAASDAASRTAAAAGYEIFETQLEAGDFTDAAHAVRDRAEKATLRECAEVVRRTLNVPKALSDELPIYDWIRRWRRNSSGKLTGKIDHIPIPISRHSPDIAVANRELSGKGLSPALRIATALMVFAAGWFLVGALERNPAHYYPMLRWLTCSTAALLTWRGGMQGSLKWAYLLVPVAILFNPIIPVHLHGKRMDVLRTWHTIDVAAAVVLFLVLALMEIQMWLMKKRHNYLFTFTKSDRAKITAQLQQAGTVRPDGLAHATKASATQETDSKEGRTVRVDGYYRFQPNMNSGGDWRRRLDEGLIDLAPGDIVKVVTPPENGMCYVNKPGKCPVIATMELVTPEWLEPVSGNFKECEYCAAIDHEASDCPLRGKVPYGWKGTGPWRVEGGKMFFDEGKPDETKSDFPPPPKGSDTMNTLTQKELDQVIRIDPKQLKNIADRAHKVHSELSDWLTTSSEAKTTTYIEMWDSLLAHVVKMQPELDAIRSDIQTMSDPTGKFIEHEFIVKYGDLVSLSQMRAQIQAALNECLKPRADGWVECVFTQVDFMEQAFKSIFSKLEEIVDRNKL